MEGLRMLVQAHVMLVLAGMWVSPATGLTCPPEEEDPPLEQMYYYSDVVVMGKVTEHYPLPRAAGRQPPDVFVAEMDVYCVYKGERVPAVLNITGAGKPPSQCFSTNFEVGMSYLTYLKKHANGYYTPSYPEDPESYKDEMIFICDVNISLPAGLQELPEGVKCEDEKDYDYPAYDFNYDDAEGQNVSCFSFKPKEDPTYKTEKTEGKENGDPTGGSEAAGVSLLLLALVQACVSVFS